jgi:hypothetical protein
MRTKLNSYKNAIKATGGEKYRDVSEIPPHRLFTPLNPVYESSLFCNDHSYIYKMFIALSILEPKLLLT